MIKFNVIEFKNNDELEEFKKCYYVQLHNHLSFEELHKNILIVDSAIFDHIDLLELTQFNIYISTIKDFLNDW